MERTQDGEDPLPDATRQAPKSTEPEFRTTSISPTPRAFRILTMSEASAFQRLSKLRVLINKKCFDWASLDQMRYGKRSLLSLSNEIIVEILAYVPARDIVLFQ
jgi:hypothetical protein